MADRLVKVLENGRMVTRGIQKIDNRTLNIEITEDETLPVTFDWSNWLGTDAISSVTNETTFIQVGSASNTTTTATFTVSASTAGFVDHRITTTAGAVKEIRMMINGGGNIRDDGYYRTR